jgi:ubiquinone/menaquinone biosynthesis C-methylase UbiE
VTREQADQVLFDRIASRYARKDLVASSSLARKSQLLSAIKPVLDELSNLGTVVDIGCGVGASAKYLAGHYERYVGIDQSKEMIKAAVMFNRGNPRAEFIAGNVKSKNLPRNIADLVLSDGALHHITELEEAMDSLVRIAKPGAFLVVREPQNGNPLLQVMRWIRGIVDSSYSKEQIFFSEKDLRELFETHGIVDLSVEFQGFLSPPFAQAILHPQVLTVPLSRVATRVDSWLNTYLPGVLRKLGFNIVVVGRFTG